MKKAIFASVCLFFLCVLPLQAKEQTGQAENGRIKTESGTATATGVEKPGQNKAGESRRGRIANCVQEMLKVAERNGGIGQQVRTLARNQNRLQEEIDSDMAKARKRNAFMRFLFGPDRNSMEAVREKLSERNKNIEVLKNLMDDIDAADREILQAQIVEFGSVQAEISQELYSQERKFSLFGWTKRFFKS